MEGSGGKDEGSGRPVGMMEGSGGCLEVPESVAVVVYTAVCLLLT